MLIALPVRAMPPKKAQNWGNGIYLGTNPPIDAEANKCPIPKSNSIIAKRYLPITATFEREIRILGLSVVGAENFETNKKPPDSAKTLFKFIQNGLAECAKAGKWTKAPKIKKIIPIKSEGVLCLMPMEIRTPVTTKSIPIK